MPCSDEPWRRWHGRRVDRNQGLMRYKPLERADWPHMTRPRLGIAGVSPWRRHASPCPLCSRSNPAGKALHADHGLHVASSQA